MVLLFCENDDIEKFLGQGVNPLFACPFVGRFVCRFGNVKVFQSFTSSLSKFLLFVSDVVSPSPSHILFKAYFKIALA